MRYLRDEDDKITMGPEDPQPSHEEVDQEESQKGSSRDQEILRDRPPHH